MKKLIVILWLAIASTLNGQEVVIEENDLHDNMQFGIVTGSEFKDFIQTNSGKTYFIENLPLLIIYNEDYEIDGLFPQGDPPPIIDFIIEDIEYQKESGDLWVLAESTLTVSSPGRWLYQIAPNGTVTLYEDILPEVISQLIVDASGIVWMGIENNLVSFNPDTGEKSYYDYSSIFGNYPPTEMKLMPDQSIWFYIGQRIIRFDGSEFSLMYHYFEPGHYISNFDVREDSLAFAIVNHSGESFLVQYSEMLPGGEIIEVNCGSNDIEVFDVHFGNYGELWVTGMRDSIAASGVTLRGTSLSALYQDEWICIEELRWKNYTPRLEIYQDIQKGIYLPQLNQGFGSLQYPGTIYNAYLDGIVGTEGDFSEQISMSVFPNPSAGALGVSYTLASGSNVDINVFDCTGRKVLHKDVDLQVPGEHTETLHLESVSNGLYFVEIISNNKKQSQRVIVNH